MKSKKDVSQDFAYKVKFPLGVKLALIIGLIVLISLGTVTILNSHFIGKDVRVTAENSNLSINSRAANIVEDKLTTTRSNVLQLLDLLNVITGGRESSFAKQTEYFFFERNQDLATIHVLSENANDASNFSIINNSFFISNELDQAVIENFILSINSQIARACHGETLLVNASPFYTIPVIALLLPYQDSGREQACVITFSLEALSNMLSSNSTNTTFIINDNDELLYHADTQKVLIGESLKNDTLVLKMRENNQNNNDSRQIPFVAEDEKGKLKDFYGAYEKLSFGDVVVLTTVPLDIILEGVITTRTNNIYLTLVIFFLSVILILCFSRYGISNHLRKLTAAAEEIKKGNFDTQLFDVLNTERNDEIGVLNQSTKDESEFLQTFAKFTNKGVAKAIARKEIDFAPHLKDVTIFFSDIRGFTSISDGFKNRFANDSPREIISFLNDYMSRMVNCITLSGGNVDKFEGDAIMAVWGLLRDDNLDYEKLPDSDPTKKEKSEKHLEHIQSDALNAITGTIAMRYALMKYNKDAEIFTKEHEGEERPKYKPEIKIGCGLNTGRATCGIMGSDDKMEYTAIGDAVNFASRTESSNKPCGTDILITEDTYNLLKEKYIRCSENNFTIKDENLAHEIIVEMIPVEFEVKGKGVQHFYGVVNMPNFDIEQFFKQGDPDFVADLDCIKAVGKTGPKTLNEVRLMLGIPIPEFEKVNLNEEENKIQVKQ